MEVNQGGIIVNEKAEEWELGHLLGQGAFAKVYTLTAVVDENKADVLEIATVAKVVVAGKIISAKKLKKQEGIENLELEISILKLINHPNIVHFIDHFVITECKNEGVIMTVNPGDHVILTSQYTPETLKSLQEKRTNDNLPLLTITDTDLVLKQIY